MTGRCRLGWARGGRVGPFFLLAGPFWCHHCGWPEVALYFRSVGGAGGGVKLFRLDPFSLRIEVLSTLSVPGYFFLPRVLVCARRPARQALTLFPSKPVSFSTSFPPACSRQRPATRIPAFSSVTGRQHPDGTVPTPICRVGATLSDRPGPVRTPSAHFTSEGLVSRNAAPASRRGRGPLCNRCRPPLHLELSFKQAPTGPGKTESRRTFSPAAAAIPGPSTHPSQQPQRRPTWA